MTIEQVGRPPFSPRVKVITYLYNTKMVYFSAIQGCTDLALGAITSLLGSSSRHAKTNNLFP